MTFNISVFLYPVFVKINLPALTLHFDSIPEVAQIGLLVVLTTKASLPLKKDVQLWHGVKKINNKDDQSNNEGYAEETLSNMLDYQSP